MVNYPNGGRKEEKKNETTAVSSSLRTVFDDLIIEIVIYRSTVMSYVRERVCVMEK